MSTLCCPNCQWQALQALAETHYFHCTHCLRDWFILEWMEYPPDEKDTAAARLFEQMFGPEVEVIVNDILKEKGVPS